MPAGMGPQFMHSIHQLPSRTSSPAGSRSVSRSTSPTRNPLPGKHSNLAGVSTSPKLSLSTSGLGTSVAQGRSPSASGSTVNASPTLISSPIAFPGAAHRGAGGSGSNTSGMSGDGRLDSPVGIVRSVSPNPNMERSRTQSSPVASTKHNTTSSTFISTPSSSAHLQSPSATRLAPLRTTSPSPSRPRDGDGFAETKRQVCPTCGKAMDPSSGSLLTPGGSVVPGGGRRSPVSPIGGGKGKKLEEEMGEKGVKSGEGKGGDERGRTRTSISLGTGATIGSALDSSASAASLLPAFGANTPSTTSSLPVPTSSASTPSSSRQSSILSPIPELKSPSVFPANPATSPPAINPLTAPSSAAPAPNLTTSTLTGKMPKVLPDVKTRAQEWGKLRALAMSISLGRVEPSDAVSGKGHGRDGTPPGLGRTGVGKGMTSPTLDRAFSGSILHTTVVEALKRQVREEGFKPSSSGTTSPTRVVGFSPVLPSASVSSSPSNPSTPTMTDHTTTTDSITSQQTSIPSVVIRRSSSVPGSRNHSPVRSGTISPVKAPEKGVAHSGSRSRAGSNASLREKGESETVEVLRKALLKVLDDAEDLSSRHENLLTTQLEIENNLKIARSNLVMAEMNAEMLEEALKRGVGGEAFGYSRQGKTPNAAGVPGANHSVSGSRPGTRPGTPTGMTPRTSVDGTNTPGRMSPANGQPPAMQRRRSGSETPTTGIVAPVPRRSETLGHGEMPIAQSLPSTAPPGLKRSSTVTGSRPTMARSNTANASGQSSQGSSGVSMGSVSGFMRKSIEKTRPGSGLMRELSQGLNINLPESFSELQTLVENNLPMPSPSSSVSRSDFFSQLGMSRPDGAASTPTLGQTNDPRRVVSGASQSSRPSMEIGISAAEMQKLRGNFAASQTTVKALTGELDIMRKSKESLEAELETLSQALFEEANKMVAEERKKAAAMEEEAKEAIAERDALKRAMRLMESGGTEGEKESRFSLGEAESDDGKGEEKGRSKRDVGTEKASPRSDFSDPETPGDRERTAEEVEALMKRMEEDFGKL